MRPMREKLLRLSFAFEHKHGGSRIGAHISHWLIVKLGG